MTEPDAQFPRKFQRQRALKGARIVCENQVTYDVTIRDLSGGGVKVKLNTPFVVPDRFDLLILNPNSGVPERRSCEKRWQRGDQLGARFVASSDDQAATAPLTSLLRKPPPA
ncbi:MAG: PilZ domain-containing protein [Alphaproteobacteria bacterium]|uniref:PilZ domain-containing protein n=1 Tax=Hyphomonas sp. TaxID=87 RepID=UPI001DA01632|nr:PilZ domain-containing protein [Hyphomonas sp.]MBU3920505.1 PilZ domain-containing protein [Alphaproteobacteria bacterium]MBU4062841.1 PilZ domain-containing protein [Alphaproteobacteria bacterium]MBU4568131.1 PilZ domain-containing protein [Alphaproteobacteria bacterium]